MKSITVEVKYWANQHGQGVIILGKLAKRIRKLAKILNIEPEQFVIDAIKRVAKQN